MDKSGKYIIDILLIIFFGIIITNTISAQIPVIELPQAAVPNIQSPVIGNNHNPHPNRNHPIIPIPSNQNDMYERDKRELEQRNNELYRLLHEHEMSANSINYDLPSMQEALGTEHYREALNEVCGMLSGKVPAKLKDAVFTVENAYFENQLNYTDYNKAINKLTETALFKTVQDGYDWNNPVTKNIILFRIMADTLDIKIPEKETSIVSYPMQYDFEDYRGENNWSKMFVSKLLATHKGQCHSLPLLYLILCEETDTEAYLAYSPSHSYVKFKDDAGNWHNLELTNGNIVSDAFIVGSGFVTAEAIKSRIYLEAQTKQQLIAQCLSDLAMGYVHKYGYDSFVNQCVDSILKYDANNLSGLMIKSNYETLRFEYVVNQVGRPHPDILKAHYPKVYKLLEDRNKTYGKVDACGYREMPKDAYESWLKSVDEEKEQREYKEKHNRVLQSIK